MAVQMKPSKESFTKYTKLSIILKRNMLVI